MSQRKIESIYPLSPVQHAMFIHTSMARGTGVYFERECWALRGNLNVPILRQSWQKVIDRHPVLRSLVWERGNDPVQVVLEQVDAPWETLDWRKLDEIQVQERLSAFLVSDLKKDFDMAKAPLMRFALIHISEDTFYFVWSWHHLLLDGWSVALIVNEVGGIYQALLQGQNLDLAQARPFEDYIKWLNQQDPSQAEMFWREELKGIKEPTPLGLDNLSVQGKIFNKQYSNLSESLTSQARAFTKKHRLTLNTLFQGLWAILLSRYSGQDDVLFGATVYGRPADLVGANEMIGMFLNVLPLRIQIGRDEPLIPWLKRIQSRFARLREFESIPLVKTHGWSEVPRSIPLFDSLVVFQNTPDVALFTVFGKTLEMSQLASSEATHYPLEIVIEPGVPLGLRITYDESRFDRSVILGILGHFDKLLEAIVEDPDRAVSDFPIVLKKPMLRSAPAAASLAFKREEVTQSVASRFEEIVQKYPDGIAVNTGNERCTYQQLNHRANQLGNALVACGLGENSRIALLLDHDVVMIAALLGALKAGVAYVPLDPNDPPERLDYILNDSRVAALVTNDNNSALAKSLQRDGMLSIVLEDVFRNQTNEPVPASPSGEEVAYILYTSGSTGKPKGIIQNNRNILHYISAYTNALHVVSSDRLSLLSSYSHDAAVVDVFTALLNGATLYPKNIRLEGLLDMGAWIEAQGITIYHSIPTVFRNLIEILTGKESLANLRYVVLGGEAVMKDDVEMFRKHCGAHCTLVNLYGSTESTISSLHFIDAQTQPERTLVPIGREIEDTEFLLLDGTGRPTDVYGEIAIRSPHHALGYWKNPTLTQEVFISDVSNKDQFVYRTGDMARLLPDGSYAFLGRKDFQVKVRGFRVEPAEIEAALASHPGVQKAVVVNRRSEQGDSILVAFVVTEPRGSVESIELRKLLKKRLPDYMVPASYVFLDALPTTPNGKIDRRALIQMEYASSDSKRVFELPRNALEQVVAGIWSEVLGAGSIGAHDNFFELGGHSLLVTKVMSRLRENLQLEVPFGTLFEAPTVAAFSEALLQNQDTRANIVRRAEMTIKLSQMSEEELNTMLAAKVSENK